MLRVALLVGLTEALRPEALSDSMALSFELASGLDDRCRSVGDIGVDVFARRGSRVAPPLVSLDPDELPHRPDSALDQYAVEEALFCQVVVAGMIRPYQLVHCLASVNVALELIAAMEIPIVQTLLVERGHPVRELPARLLPSHLLRQVEVRPEILRDAGRVVPPGVDLTRFTPVEDPRDDFLLCLGNEAEKTQAAEIARLLDLPLRTDLDGDLAWLLQNARALLHLVPAPSPAGAVWPLRALACGTSVAAWSGSGLETILGRPGMGALAPRGDVAELAARLAGLPTRGEAGSIRRLTCLGRYGARAMIGAYCDVYRELLTPA